MAHDVVVPRMKLGRARRKLPCWVVASQRVILSGASWFHRDAESKDPEAVGSERRLAAFFRGIGVPAVVVRKRSSAVVCKAASRSFGCAQDDSVELKWSEQGRSRFLTDSYNYFTFAAADRMIVIATGRALCANAKIPGVMSARARFFPQ
jgi:hypothetical protein